MKYINEDSLIKAGCVHVSTLPQDHPVSIILSETSKDMAAKLADVLEQKFLEELQQKAE